MDSKFLIVRFTAHLYHQIRRQRQVTTLQILLQARLRIFCLSPGLISSRRLWYRVQDQALNVLDIAVEKIPPIKSFNGVRQYRFTAENLRFSVHPAQDAGAHLIRTRGQFLPACYLSYQRRAHAAHIAFVYPEKMR